jgi:uncharacterized hydrophobic protein (TIGR00271 family)
MLAGTFHRCGDQIMNVLTQMVRESTITPEDVSRLESKLFFDGVKRRRQLEQFSVLLFLAAIIATMGVLGDSTATVIGAMIIAPLMTPIMATAAALVMGQMRRAGRSFLTVVIGVLGVIALPFFLAFCYHLIMGGVVNFGANSQILARVSPRVIDLVAALASGAAGAFCLSREDVSDSLAGVAISISLVPPLCVVGISLQGGQLAAAEGAFLLFVTNFLSILLAGGGVLALLGLHRAATVEVKGTARRNAFIVVVLGVLIVMVPLAITGARIAADARAELQGKEVVGAWINGTGFKIRSLQAAGDQINIIIIGHGDPPVFSDLVAGLNGKLQRPVTVNLDVIPSTSMSYP